MQAQVMMGRSIDNAATVCEDLGKDLQDDLTTCIDWRWLEVGALQTPVLPRWGAYKTTATSSPAQGSRWNHCMSSWCIAKRSQPGVC